MKTTAIHTGPISKDQARERAIEICTGLEIEVGRVVAHMSNPLSMRLVRYEGEEAVCDDVKQGVLRFPRAEIFDPNKVVNVANHLLNLGFWSEGMESKILTIEA